MGQQRITGNAAVPEPLVALVARLDPTEPLDLASRRRPDRLDPAHPASARPPGRLDPAQRAAVLVLLTDAPDPEVLLTVRSSELNHHAGQVSFPGGAIEPGETPVAAALRETAEEIGLPAAAVHLLGALPAARIAVSRFAVSIVVAWWDGAAPLVGNSAEVEAIVEVPLSLLADPATRFTWRHPRGTTGPGFAWADLVVWGFTAGVLDTVLATGGWARPWDATDVRPVPERFLRSRSWR